MSAAFGVHEANVARRLYHFEDGHWWLTLLSALTVLAFGATTLTMLFAPFDVAVAVIITWFAGYAVCLGIVASALQEKPAVERALVPLGLIHAAIAGLALVMPVYPRLSRLALPAVGAAYALLLFGLWQIVLATWMLKQLPRDISTSTNLQDKRGQFSNAIRATRML